MLRDVLKTIHNTLKYTWLQDIIIIRSNEEITLRQFYYYLIGHNQSSQLKLAVKQCKEKYHFKQITSYSYKHTCHANKRVINTLQLVVGGQ